LYKYAYHLFHARLRHFGVRWCFFQ
jgi:hypothetical protein